jgi:hypothetical protein
MDMPAVLFVDAAHPIGAVRRMAQFETIRNNK